MSEFLEKDGFLDLGASMGADVALVSMIALAILFTIGVVMAVKQHYEVHRWIQTTAVTLSTIVMLWIMLAPFQEDVVPGIPGELNNSYFVLLTAHALLGVLAVLLGVFIALRGNKLVPKALQFENYKPVMRISYTLYMLTTLLGIWVYVIMPDRVATG